MVAFPIGKLIYLGIKQLSKPISVQLRSSAAKHPFVSKYICAPPAQLLHRLDTFVRRRLMGVKGKAEYKPLSEERAVEMGSEILGEAFLYSVAAAAIFYEYWRSTRNDQRKEDIQNLEISELKNQTERLERDIAQLQKTIDSLQIQLQTHTPAENVTSNKQPEEHVKSKSMWIW